MTQGALSGARGALYLDAMLPKEWVEELRALAPVLGRVCMALLGEKGAAERALERVAREAGEKGIPAGSTPRVFLLGLAHRACTTQLSRMPIRKTENVGLADTEKVGEGESFAARVSLARLKPTEREAVVMHLVGGLDPAEVAAACGIDESVAKARIGSGLSLLASSKETK